MTKHSTAQHLIKLTEDKPDLHWENNTILLKDTKEKVNKCKEHEQEDSAEWRSSFVQINLLSQYNFNQNSSLHFSWNLINLF